MKSSFAIAYTDKDGTDFNGIPWILDDLNNEKECMSKALEMVTSGYKNVILFCFEKRRKKNEEFTWEYVREYRIDLK